MIDRFVITGLTMALAFPVALFLVMFPIAIVATVATAAGFAIAQSVITVCGFACAAPVAYRIAASFEQATRV